MKRFVVLALSSLLSACQTLGMREGDGPTSTAKGIVAAGAQWEEVSRMGVLFAEGVVADKSGKIYVSDLTRTAVIKQGNPGGSIYRFDPATGKTTKFMEPSAMTNGMHVDKNGDLLMAQDADTGGRQVLRKSLTTGDTFVVASTFEGKRFNGANDVTSDALGRIYFTDGKYAGSEACELPNAIYRVDVNGRITRLGMDVLRPNGIEVSPDGRRLYVSAANIKRLPTNPHGPATDRFGITMGGVVRYDLDANGNVANGRLIYRNDELATDGMVMDTDGNLYVTAHNANREAPKSEVVVLDPSGAVIERIPLPPGALATNLGFGRGAEADVLYMSSALPWRLYRIKTVRRGHYF